jgi:hypothetical protein
VVKHKITSKENFISFWKEFISELSEKDTIDEKKAVEAINFVDDIRTRRCSFI